MAKPKSLTKAVVLSLAVALMLPVASSWQQMFGSVQKAIGNRIAVQSALDEKQRMEEEIDKMMEQMKKLEELISKLEQDL